MYDPAFTLCSFHLISIIICPALQTLDPKIPHFCPLNTVLFLGTFIRIVDAVKGPRSPSPTPHPTYPLSKDDPEYPQFSLMAPVSETDAGKFKEPENPY